MSILKPTESDETDDEIQQIDKVISLHHRQKFPQIMKRLNYLIVIILIIVTVKEN